MGDEYSLEVLKKCVRRYREPDVAPLRVMLMPSDSILAVTANKSCEMVMECFRMQYLVNKTLRSLNAHESALHLRLYPNVKIEYDSVPLLGLQFATRSQDICPPESEEEESASDPDDEDAAPALPAVGRRLRMEVPTVWVARAPDADGVLPPLTTDCLVFDIVKMEEEEDSLFEAQQRQEQAARWYRRVATIGAMITLCLALQPWNIFWTTLST